MSIVAARIVSSSRKRGESAKLLTTPESSGRRQGIHVCPPSADLPMPPSPPAKMTLSTEARAVTVPSGSPFPVAAQAWSSTELVTPPKPPAQTPSGVARSASTGDGRSIAGRWIQLLLTSVHRISWPDMQRSP